MSKTKKDQDKIEVEPGAEKRLVNMLKKALNTPPQHQIVGKGKSPKSKDVAKTKR